MSHFDQFIQYRALDFKYGDFGASYPDQLKDQLRTVCFQVTPSVFDDLESVCQLLGVTKRRFVELAVIDALERTHEIVKGMDTFEFAREDQQRLPEPEEVPL